MYCPFLFFVVSMFCLSDLTAWCGVVLARRKSTKGLSDKTNAVGEPQPLLSGWAWQSALIQHLTHLPLPPPEVNSSAAPLFWIPLCSMHGSPPAHLLDRGTCHEIGSDHDGFITVTHSFTKLNFIQITDMMLCLLILPQSLLFE